MDKKQDSKGLEPHKPVKSRKKGELRITCVPIKQPVANTTPPRNLDSRAFITIGDKNFEVEADDLVAISELGRGAYGVVEKVRHTQSGTIMAVKRIRATVNTQEQKRLLMDLDISMRTVDCFYTVTFYGALFREGDVWICMELMDTSLDKFYKKVLEKKKTIPEDILGKMAVSIVRALEHLHSKLSVIHRDVKPSNVLINKEGHVKMCDFGISGYLVDSVAKTMDAGCKPYMAPERINPELNQKGYNVKSDVWSLGITMVTGPCWDRHAAGVGLGWGLCWLGSVPAVTSSSWWLHPWVDAHQMGLNLECDRSRHEMNYPGHRVEV
ncbi:dual specificity mitogen-activated protein kinase kinase 3-like isoform X2 [Strigops habroptila]|uniref:dual specificity mitogen-activated protein kinase kinase 3-like isoform X2 n=1 Tax=Strigops habroptila TaxID=2489341 RepID=UPI0011CF7C0C|nr:dual specificity mitogen-activated protein kinase kinase 3-like isoform X2 [Strigops habroptila]